MPQCLLVTSPHNSKQTGMSEREWVRARCAREMSAESSLEKGLGLFMLAKWLAAQVCKLLKAAELRVGHESSHSIYPPLWLFGWLCFVQEGGGGPSISTPTSKKALLLDSKPAFLGHHLHSTPMHKVFALLLVCLCRFSIIQVMVNLSAWKKEGN